jgi:glycosyltransferase involved in cell wall biosynthesis
MNGFLKINIQLKMKLNVLLFLPNDFSESEVKHPENYFQFHIIRQKDFDQAKLINQSYFEYLSDIMRKTKAVSWVTIGSVNWYEYLQHFPFEYRKRWIHKNDFSDWKEDHLNYCYFGSMYTHRFESTNPLISVFTTTFHSGEKLLRPLHSLQSQTYRNWEWIIWDDSKDDETYKSLLELQRKDIRIQVYKAPEHSGFIGEMKKRSCGLSKGKWLVELDHDDPIAPTLFQRIVDIDQKHPETDFIYSDYALVKEDDKTDTHYGGDYYGFGYGGHMYQWSTDGKTERYYLTLTNPSLNAATVRYIVGAPNHIRAWKATFYHQIQAHQPLLPVVDDYELLLRTFLHSKNWVRIPEPLYFQYQNSGGNNFTYLRNALIQHLTRWTAHLYEPRIHERLLEIGFEDKKHTHEVCWQRNFWESPYFGKIDDRFENDLTIIIPVEQDCYVEELKSTLDSIFQQSEKRWKVYLIGNQSGAMGPIIHWLTTTRKEFCPKVDWWNMRERTSTHILLNYILKMYITNVNLERWVTYWKSPMVMEKGCLEQWFQNKGNQLNGKNEIYGFVHSMKYLENELWKEKTLNQI